MADTDENIQTLMEITSMSFEDAKRFLRTRNSLQGAIDAYFNDNGAMPDVMEVPNDISNDMPGPSSCIPGPSSSGSGPSSSGPSSSSNSMPELDENHPDYVRPPIAPRRDILVLPEHDNFRSIKRHNVTQALCPLRNFAREAELQEEMLFGQGGSASSGLPRPKRSKLEDVFRPPTDMIFSGTFQMVKEYAKNDNSWLMVNLQDNKEFLCQVLNRDIWSNKEVKSIIKKYFIFYQTSVDCIEGNKIRAFYKVEDFPYVAIIDPRTGEEQKSYRGPFKLTVEEFCKEIYTFLHNNFTPEYIETGSTTPLKRQTDSQTSVPSTPQRVNDDTPNIISLTEEEQLEIAIQKSLQEASASQNHSDDSDDYEEPSDEESEAGSSRTATPRRADSALPSSSSKNAAVAGVKKALLVDNGSEDVQSSSDTNGPMTRLMLRLPNGKSEMINRGSKTTIGELVAFIQKNYRSLVSLETCRINCPAIRKDLYDIDKNSTLEEAKLHPSAVLHISSDD